MLRKNGDWTVILGDIAHWARTSPQVYFLVIGGLAIALMVAMYHPSQPQQVQRVPAPTYQQQPIQTRPAPPIGVSPSAVVPVQKCVSDHIFIDSLGTCTPIISTRWYILHQGSILQLSQNTAMVVTNGSVRITPAPPHNTYTSILNAVQGSNRTVMNGGSVLSLEEATRIGFQFPVARQ